MQYRNGSRRLPIPAYKAGGFCVGISPTRHPPNPHHTPRYESGGEAKRGAIHACQIDRQTNKRKASREKRKEREAKRQQPLIRPEEVDLCILMDPTLLPPSARVFSSLMSSYPLLSKMAKPFHR